MPSVKFRFHKGDHIGAASAEEDSEFLSSSYVNTGDLDLLRNVADSRVIVLGRTGTGKSALLRKLAEGKGENAISISPESLALSYVSNSTMLNFLAGMQVNLDPFFKLLWRHVFTIEILTHHFDRMAEPKKKGLWDRLSEMFASDTRQDKAMKDALSYLNEWGEKFWLQTEYRVKEITQNLETKLDAEIKATLGLSAASLASTFGAAQKLTVEEKGELRSRAQQVISQAQVQDLTHVLELLDTVLTDKQQQYYVLIDGLDENWVEERLRYRFIMALIATAREFVGVKNAKVVLALRRDLIDRVFRLARDAGFQEEKYRSLYLPLVWTQQDILQVLDRRISALVSRRYTKQPVTHRDLLPTRYEKTEISSYIVKVATTPRDVIVFFNECIAVATEHGRITAQPMKIAMANYSRSRLRALADEWSGDYPALLEFARILQRRSASFKLGLISDAEVEDVCLEICAENPGSSCLLVQKAMTVVDCITSAADFRVFLMQVFYRTGLIGLKLTPHEEPTWADESGRGISAGEIGNDSSVVVLPKYHRALGIRH